MRNGEVKNPFNVILFNILKTTAHTKLIQKHRHAWRLHKWCAIHPGKHHLLYNKEWNLNTSVLC